MYRVYATLMASASLTATSADDAWAKFRQKIIVGDFTGVTVHEIEQDLIEDLDEITEGLSDA